MMITLNLGTGLKSYMDFLLLKVSSCFIMGVVSMMHGTLTFNVCFGLCDGNMTASGEMFVNVLLIDDHAYT